MGRLSRTVSERLSRIQNPERRVAAIPKARDSTLIMFAFHIRILDRVLRLICTFDRLDGTNFLSTGAHQRNGSSLVHFIIIMILYYGTLGPPHSRCRWRFASGQCPSPPTAAGKAPDFFSTLNGSGPHVRFTLRRHAGPL